MGMFVVLLLLLVYFGFPTKYPKISFIILLGDPVIDRRHWALERVLNGTQSLNDAQVALQAMEIRYKPSGSSI